MSTSTSQIWSDLRNIYLICDLIPDFIPLLKLDGLMQHRKWMHVCFLLPPNNKRTMYIKGVAMNIKLSNQNLSFHILSQPIPLLVFSFLSSNSFCPQGSLRPARCVCLCVEVEGTYTAASLTIELSERVPHAYFFFPHMIDEPFFVTF